MDTQIAQKLYELRATLERENEDLAEEIGDLWIEKGLNQMKRV